jgi:hypothetical protein
LAGGLEDRSGCGPAIFSMPISFCGRACDFGCGEYWCRQSAAKSEPRGRIADIPQSLSKWFDPARYVAAPQCTYGQVKGLTLQSAAFRQYDASVFKNFALPGESVLSFRVEFFNLRNTNSFNAPASTINSSSCCAVTSTSIPSRDIQFALKYNF